MKGRGGRGVEGLNKYVLIYSRYSVTLNLSCEKNMFIVYVF